MGTRSGFRIGSVRGIPVRVHFTFLLVLPFLAYAFGDRLSEAARIARVPPGRLAGPPWLWGLAVALALFLSVLVHEMAHSLYALRRGGRVRSITLLMIGGVSEMEKPPRRPADEAVMALVGPAVSLLLGGIFFALFGMSRATHSFELTFALFYLGYLNLFLGGFNLLPAFPMDGGRVLRGLLAQRIGLVRATRIAAGIGKAFALAFAAIGFLSANFILAVIGLFVFLGAEGESREVLARTVLGTIPVRDVTAPRTAAVLPDETLFDVGERMVRERRLAFPVVDGGQAVGVVTLEGIEALPLERRRSATVRDAMTPALVVHLDDRVSEALRLLAGRGASHLAVADADGHVVGTVSRIEIERALKLRELSASQHPPGGDGLRHARAGGSAPSP